MLSEVLFPQAGCEEMDVKGGMGIDPLEDIDQIDVGIDALEATRSQQALDDADMPGADFRPTEQPVAAAQRNGANLPLQMIGIERDIGVGQKHFEGGFAFQRIAGRLGKGIGGQEHFGNHRLFEPGKEGLDQRFGILAPMSELGLCL